MYWARFGCFTALALIDPKPINYRGQFPLSFYKSKSCRFLYSSPRLLTKLIFQIKYWNILYNVHTFTCIAALFSHKVINPVSTWQHRPKVKPNEKKLKNNLYLAYVSSKSNDPCKKWWPTMPKFKGATQFRISFVLRGYYFLGRGGVSNILGS